MDTGFEAGGAGVHVAPSLKVVSNSDRGVNAKDM